MLKKLLYEDFLRLSEKNNRIVYYQEIPADSITPILAYEALGTETADGALLESGSKDDLNNRYSYICLYPYYKFSVDGTEVTVEEDGEIREITVSPIDALRETLKANKSYFDHPLTGFVGGAVGFISYDAVRLFENIPDRHISQKGNPDILLKFYEANIIFDHKSDKAIIAVLSRIDGDADKSYKSAAQKAEFIINKIFTFKFQQIIPNLYGNMKEGVNPEVSVTIDDESFKARVRKAKEYIVKGDAFQIVLSRCFSRPYSVNSFSIYRALRMTNPSPYMFYLENGAITVVGSSPEKLVSLENGTVETCPIAGTRKRGRDTEEDNALARELLADEKENAEHVMLVDLARNDLGAVCVPGSVKVENSRQIHNFSRVMHITSQVKGALRGDKDVIDVLRALFPAGTLSGAPKIRAMEIIDELEESRRGLYGGAVCLIDGKGNFNSCIVIRTALLKGGVAYVQAGAGIVFDSDPQLEAEETRHKAEAVLNSIELAEGGAI